MTTHSKDIKILPTEKTGLHPRNPHRFAYDFKVLIKACPELTPFVALNKYGNESVNFSDPAAVIMLNRALLMHFYAVKGWDIPAGYLCPPIPGRADYIHHAADLLASCNGGKIPYGKSVRVLDIGMGASLVYPIIGNKVYDWSFVGTDIDPVAIASVRKLLKANPVLEKDVEIRVQKSATDIFKGIIMSGEYFDLVISNPPFHASLAEAQAGTERKWKNLGHKKGKTPARNFGGQHTELWCEGGEQAFIGKMIEQSKDVPESSYWFSTLVSKSESLRGIYRALKKAGAVDVKTIDMAQGQKTSRFVAWSFLSKSRRTEWGIRNW
ncbi:MAG: 23S rRNA (adenine(1618)-N(6))-methyltransferase RlmF [Bacteroidia bacterium]